MTLELEYIRNLSNTLQNFRIVNHRKINFRCPLCGDSKKSSKKSRGYLLQQNGKYFFYCHNCNTNLKFSDFLQTVSPLVYNDYVKDRLKEQSIKTEEQKYHREIKEYSLTRILNLPKISQLENDHIAKEYVLKRHIPNQYHPWIFYAHNYKAFTNTILPEYFKQTLPRENRLIIPLLNTNKKLLGFQGRALTDARDRLKYITILFNEANPKLYNMDRVDFNRKYFILEGPIDSMFIDNSIATCGGKITSALEEYSLPSDNAVVVYDNNPRNPQVVNNLRHAIDAGYRVVIWPDHIQAKDINDLVNSLLPKRFNNETILRVGEKIKHEILESNIYSGIRAKLKFAQWKKT